MSRLTDLKIPASFIGDWGLPTGPELGYGFRQGWITAQDVIRVALTKYEAGVRLTPDEEELALLMSDQLEQVGDIAERLEFSDQPVERRVRYWALLTFGWLLENRSNYTDPFRLIDMLYADFDYPEEVRPFVGYTPLNPGDTPGREGLLERWRDCVDQWRREYRHLDERATKDIGNSP